MFCGWILLILCLIFVFECNFKESYDYVRGMFIWMVGGLLLFVRNSVDCLLVVIMGIGILKRMIGWVGILFLVFGGFDCEGVFGWFWLILGVFCVLGSGWLGIIIRYLDNKGLGFDFFYMNYFFDLIFFICVFVKGG